MIKDMMGIYTNLQPMIVLTDSLTVHVVQWLLHLGFQRNVQELEMMLM